MKSNCMKLTGTISIFCCPMRHTYFKTAKAVKKMKEGIDFLKVKDYAVINLNNMFPVIKNVYTYVDISKEKDVHYRALLQAEYRYIKSIKDKILKNAATLYNIKKRDGNSSALAKRCNDFLKLEEICVQYLK